MRAVGGGWWRGRRLSLRARLMLLGVVGLAMGLALGGVVLVAALGLALQRAVDAGAMETARGVATLIDEQGAPPDPVPVAGVDVVVQVIDDQSRIRSASINADRLSPLLTDADLARVRAGERLYVDGTDAGAPGTLRVVAVTAGPPTARLTVLVARSTTAVVQSVALVRTTVMVAFPLLVVVLAAVAWRVIGATLRPVEALRRGAEEITGGALRGRLPVPAAHDEIHRLAVTLNGMLDRLAGARARQRAFVADAAHELRSPLANMRTQLEVAQRLGPATDWPVVADDLLTDTERLARLVDDLLLLARADEAAADPAGTSVGRPGRRAAAVDLGDLVADLAARYPAPPVVVRPPAAPCRTRGDADALCRVVANLLDNAVRHARTRVEVAVGPGGPAGDPVVTVTDDGAGIPAADRDRVFDRFTRLDEARARDAGGAGLGLAIVRELVRRHGGEVWLSDAEPGLRVHVRLPAYRPDPAAGDGVEPRDVHTGAAGATTSAEYTTATVKQ